MADDQPFFRFHPGAYEAGRAFEATDAPCGVCKVACIWRYTGVIYVEGDAPRVCARCIAGDRLAAHLGDRSYSLIDASFEDADPGLVDEIVGRTPGFATYNAFDWPVIDGRPLVFVGYGDSKGMWADPEVRAAMVSAFEDELEEDLDGPTSYALIFKELDGPRYRVAVDLD